MLKVYLLAVKKQLNILLGQSHKIMNNFIMLIKQKKTIILFVVVVGLATIIFLSFRFFTPFGAVVSYQFNSIFDRDKLSKLKGAEETSSFNPTQTGVLQIPQQTIRQNIVTFNLKLITAPIEGVWINLKFKGNPKEIKIGVRGSEKEEYFYKPLYQQQLEQLKIPETANNLLFWQKEPLYPNLEQFIEKPPVDKTTATYFFSLGDFSLSQKKVSSLSEKNTIFARTLRGSHAFFIRVDKKPFNITVEKKDANVYKGEDVLLIELYKGDKQVMKKEIPDDGISDVSNLKMKPQTEQVEIDSLESGVYKLVLTDKSQGMDVLINKIETNQTALVSSSPFYILDDRPATIWTNSKKITVITWHDESLQTVKLDSLYDFKIDKRNENYEFNLNKPETADNTRELHQLDIPKNDLIISGDGYFAFSEESFFNPEPIKTVDLSTVSDIDKIDYIIANYQPAKKDGDWYTAQAYFDPKDIKIDGDKLYFSLESPGLNGYGGEIVIDNLEVTVKKPGWFNTPPNDSWNSDKDTVQKETNKQNIFTRFIDWIKKKLPFGKPAKSTPTPTSSVRITPTSKPSPTATTSATPTSAEISKSVKINILNAGAPAGYAKKYADLIKEAGYENVETSNAEEQNFENAKIHYPFGYAFDAGKIEEILKGEYKSVDKIVDIGSTEITITIGSI